MKIAFLSFYSGEIYRGVETFVHELSNHLVKKGIEVTVFQNGPQIKNAEYKTHSISLKIDWAQDFSPLIKTFSEHALKELDSDTDIVFPTNGKWQSFLCKLWALKYEKKMIISGQSGVGRDDRINLYTFPDCFVSLTLSQQNANKSRNPFIKHTTIPNGVNLESFNKTVVPMKIKLPGPIILCVSALVDWKRINLAIEAVSHLSEGSLLIVGKGEQKESLQKLAEEKIPGRYEFLNVPFSDMPKVYQAADVFTFPTSSWESFGIVLLEAMASGLPVVVSDDPIRREIVGDAGFFVDPTNTHEYSKALEKALKINGKDLSYRRAEQFSWDKIADQYISLFKLL